MVDNSSLLQFIEEKEQYVKERLENNTEEEVYEVATYIFLECFIKFEQFIINSYIDYLLGEKSILNYKPNVNVEFKSQQAILTFHKKIDGFFDVKVIGKIYGDAFSKSQNPQIANPFEGVFGANSIIFEKLVAIRNYIAHQSEDAKTKFHNKCNSGAPVELYNYLFVYGNKYQNFTKHLKDIKDLSNLIVNPIYS